MTYRPLDTGNQNISVETCPGCKGTHPSVAAKRYHYDASPFTHWYMCPTSVEPCGIALMTKDGTTVFKPNADVIKALCHAQESGRYLAAIFTPVGEDNVRLDRITHQFPTIAFKQCVKELQDNLNKETGPPEATDLKEGSTPDLPVKLFSE